MTLAQYLMLNVFTQTDPEATPLWFWREPDANAVDVPTQQDLDAKFRALGYEQSAGQLLPAVEFGLPRA